MIEIHWVPWQNHESVTYFRAVFYCILSVLGLTDTKFVSPREKLWVYKAGLTGKKITEDVNIFAWSSRPLYQVSFLYNSHFIFLENFCHMPRPRLVSITQGHKPGHSGGHIPALLDELNYMGFHTLGLVSFVIYRLFIGKLTSSTWLFWDDWPIKPQHKQSMHIFTEILVLSTQQSEFDTSHCQNFMKYQYVECPKIP